MKRGILAKNSDGRQTRSEVKPGRAFQLVTSIPRPY